MRRLKVKDEKTKKTEVPRSKAFTIVQAGGRINLTGTSLDNPQCIFFSLFSLFSLDFVYFV